MSYLVEIKMIESGLKSKTIRIFLQNFYYTFSERAILMKTSTALPKFSLNFCRHGSFSFEIYLWWKVYHRFVLTGSHALLMHNWRLQWSHTLSYSSPSPTNLKTGLLHKAWWPIPFWVTLTKPSADDKTGHLHKIIRRYTSFWLLKVLEI